MGAEDGTIVGTEINGWCAGLTGLSSVETSLKRSGYGAYRIVSNSATHNECAVFSISGSPTTVFFRFYYTNQGGTTPAPSFPQSVAYGFRAAGSHPHICI